MAECWQAACSRSFMIHDNQNPSQLGIPKSPEVVSLWIPGRALHNFRRLNRDHRNRSSEWTRELSNKHFLSMLAVPFWRPGLLAYAIFHVPTNARHAVKSLSLLERFFKRAKPVQNS